MHHKRIQHRLQMIPCRSTEFCHVREPYVTSSRRLPMRMKGTFREPDLETVKTIK